MLFFLLVFISALYTTNAQGVTDLPSGLNRIATRPASASTFSSTMASNSNQKFDTTPIPQPSPNPTPTPQILNSAPQSQSSSFGQSFIFQGSTRVLIGGCFDITPPNSENCQRQKEMGKCSRNWMLVGGLCAKTCGYCETECFDIQPSESYTCQQEKQRNQCNENYMINNNYCKKTCGRCESTAVQTTVAISPTSPQKTDAETFQNTCTDFSPDDEYSCSDQKKFGKCDMSWMIVGGFCQKTCGRCQDSIGRTSQGTCSCEACFERQRKLIVSEVELKVAGVLKDIFP
eukprot:TRINITY_DN10036_c0_g1_i7.p1 TRINITY_DN10036_c0_g1~~TRINITY_DN10036_c0_g1_i7.p1  ORF type:complete len:319 (-),score=9.96 TRINITY_DN10036_c0_g1_i7:224-1087(-)